MMREGARGLDVMAVQDALKKAGFNPGVVDGLFGPATEAAVMAFQRSERLLADGVVGPRTAAFLKLDPGRMLGGMASFSPGKLPDISVGDAAAMCPGAPVRNIEQNLPLVLAALREEKLDTLPLLLCGIATIRAECASFAPENEGLSRFNTSPNGPDFDLYDYRADLGNTGHPDGMVFRGRGFVQITGRANYAKFGPMAGVPNLVSIPTQANDPAIAARLLAVFMSSRAIRLKEALAADDLRAARRLVNGGSHGLQAFVDAYRTGQRRLLLSAAI